MSRESARRRQRDDPRIVGTFEERILFHRMAAAVLCRLPELHRDVAVDWGSFEHITLAFLRERDAGSDVLWGRCSYAGKRSRGYVTLHQNRHGIHRIMLHRPLLHENPMEAVRTIHHEFVHAIVGHAAGHGSVFQEHELRWTERHCVEVLREICA